MAEKVEFYTPGPNAVDISPDKDGKVLKEIVVAGEGAQCPGKGNRVFVHYTGKLLDGTKFDSSVDRGEMFEFTLGKGEVIKAWDVGVATMTKGEKCILQCHPEFAYGKSGSPPKIPENATLIFEVELFKWDLEDLSPDKDGGILRLVILEGEENSTPNDGASVEVHLVGKFKDNIFEERDVKFEIGEASEANVIEGVDVALKKFKKGEKSVLTLSPKYAFGSSGDEGFNIPPNSTVEYEVTLKSFEKGKESWSMTPAEKLEQSEIVKNKGTNYFKLGKYELASKHYNKIISYLKYESDIEDKHKSQRNVLLLAGYLNLAACHLKLEKYPDVLQNCNKALEIEANNAKGLFRRGQGRVALKEYEEARKDFERVLEVESGNKAAHNQLLLCREKMRKELEREKQLYKAIFQRMAQEESDSPKDKPEEVPSMNGDQEVKVQTDDEKQAEAEAIQS